MLLCRRAAAAGEPVCKGIFSLIRIRDSGLFFVFGFEEELGGNTGSRAFGDSSVGKIGLGISLGFSLHAGSEAVFGAFSA